MMDESTPLFAIAVAAELAAMHPQTLRQYDRMGLVRPQRTAGQSRRYSMRDVVQLREIARMSAEGLNLEGIRRILALDSEIRLHTDPFLAAVRKLLSGGVRDRAVRNAYGALEP